MLQASWTSPLYSMQLLSAPAVAMQACWRDEDAFFAAVADWEALPIETRRPFGFYYAHLAAFSKLKLFPEVSLSASLACLAWPSWGVQPWCQPLAAHLDNGPHAGLLVGNRSS